MKASTLVAILCGLIALFGAFIWEGGIVSTLFMAPALLIVFGGTFAAALAGSSIDHIKKVPKLFLIAFNPPKYDIFKLIDQITAYSYQARKDGILSLEPHLNEINHIFFKKIMQQCIDGADPESIQKVVEIEIGYMTERHSSYNSLFVKMGGYAPTMGIIGTVMGLIAVLASAGADPNEMIHHIATAFIATLWGILSANLLWLPLADKLKNVHNEEVQMMQLIFDGMQAVHLGEPPAVVRSKLISCLPSKLQSNFEESERKTIEIPVEKIKKYKTIDKEKVITP